MLDVAAHMLLLERQARIKHEQPADASFLPMSLTIACLLRQLPAGLAPPLGILSFHQIDHLPIETLEQKLYRLLYGESAGDQPVRGSATLERAFDFLRAIVIYMKTARAMLTLCHEHMANQLTTEETSEALVEFVVAALSIDESVDLETGVPLGQHEQVETDEIEAEDAELVSDDEHKTALLQAQPRCQKAERRDRHRRRRRGGLGLLSAPVTAHPTRGSEESHLSVPTLAVDPSGIMKRALARDAGDGSAIVEIMTKYPDDVRVQTHGVRALKTAIRKLPFKPAESRQPRQSSEGGSDDSDHDQQQNQTRLKTREDQQRRHFMRLVLDRMSTYPTNLSLQRDALFCLLEVVGHGDEHISTITAQGGVVSIMEAMARLPDDEEAQIAALSILGHPALAEESVVHVNPESRRLVLSAMQRFPLSERLQGLACLALANLSLRQDESMREIVARDGLELVIVAMNRFNDVNLIQAAGCWLLATVSSKDDEMLAACLDAGGLPPCEKARVRFASDPRVQQHALLAIQSLVRDVPEHSVGADTSSQQHEKPHECQIQ